MPRPPWTRRASLLALLSVCLSAYLFRPGSDAPGLAALALLIGAGAYWVAQRSAGAELEERIVELPPTQRRKLVSLRTLIRLIPFLGGLLCLALLTEINTGLLQSPLHKNVSIHLQILLLTGGGALIVIGLAKIRWRQIWPRPGEALTVTGVLALAFLLRVWDLENSVRALIDEPHMVSAIVDLRRNPTTTLLAPFHPIAAFSWIYPYLELLSSEIFGSTLTGLRMVSAIFGTMSVGAVYMLGRGLFNRRVALVAALLLATFPPHLHFSRLGLLAISDALFGILALAGLLSAMRTSQRSGAVICGAMIGALFYFADGAKLLFPPLILGWLIWTTFSAPLRLNWRGWLWILLPALCIALPVILTFQTNGTTPLSRFAGYRAPAPELDLRQFFLSAEGGEALRILLEKQLLPPLLHLVHLPDQSTIFYVGETALILTLLLPFFFLGLFYALHQRQTGALLGGWLLLTILGNSLLEHPAWTPRFIVVFPALMLILALGLLEALPALMKNLHSHWNRRLQRWATGALVIVVCIFQAAYYFGPHLERFRQTSPMWKDYFDAGFRAADLPPETTILLVHPDVVFPIDFTILFAYLDAEPYFNVTQYDALTLPMLEGLPPDENFAFFLDPQDSRTLRWLELLWELDGPYFSPYNVPLDRQYRLYLAPSGSRKNADEQAETGE